MKYFKGLVDIEQAKFRYRKLAKQLHPDLGGTADEFQKMQEEYKTLILHFQQTSHVDAPPKQPSLEDELFSDVGKLAKVLIKKQVSQAYLQQKIQTTDSPIVNSFLRFPM